MKKTILAQLIVCTFAFTSLSAMAGAADTGANSNEVSPNTESQTLSTNGSTNVSDDDDGEDNDYGWIGLLGMLGLAGLMRKDRDTNGH